MMKIVPKHIIQSKLGLIPRINDGPDSHRQKSSRLQQAHPPMYLTPRCLCNHWSYQLSLLSPLLVSHGLYTPCFQLTQRSSIATPLRAHETCIPHPCQLQIEGESSMGDIERGFSFKRKSIEHIEY